MIRVVATLSLALALAMCFLPRAGVAAMMPYAQSDPALWRWLPHYEDLFEPWRRQQVAPASLTWREMFTVPNQRFVVYDPSGGIVLYFVGCCAWQETVLAVVTGSPPERLRVARLAALKTPRGIGLGATMDAVRSAYGPARSHRPTTGAVNLDVLSYYRQTPTSAPSCGFFENFVFRGNRLIEIQAGHGC